MVDIPPTPRGKIWIFEPPDRWSDDIEDEVWRALHEYLAHDDAFVYVEGDQIGMHLGPMGPERVFPLKEALRWDIEGLAGLDGKIPAVGDIADPTYRSRHAEGIAGLRRLRAILAETIAEIDAALPDE